MKYYQQKVTKGNQIICTFWTDEYGYIDSANLPSNGEFAELLEQLINHELSVEATGVVVDED